MGVPVEIAVALTLWLSFGAFLVLPWLGAPPILGRMAIGLCASELLAATVWAAARDACHAGSCPALMDTAGRVAGVQVPALTGLLLLVGAACGVHVARNW